jgi:hypothetical protein
VPSRARHPRPGTAVSQELAVPQSTSSGRGVLSAGQPARYPGAGHRAHTEQVPRPALLLDVDGVLNPYGAVTCPEGFTEHDLFPGEEPVRLCRAHGEWISKLRHVAPTILGAGY